MNSSNDTTTAEQLYSDTEKVVLIALYVVIFTVALYGNSIGLYVVCVKTASRRITNLLIKNLAIADLIFTVTIMPYSVLFMFFQPYQWFGGIAGEITCKAFFYAIPVSIAASVTTMVVITLDRFCAIYFPLNQTLFHKHKTVTAVIWFISLISMTPYLLLYNVYDAGEYYVCVQDWPWADNLLETFLAVRTVNVIFFVLLYALPLLMITVLNSIIGRRLWHHRAPGSIASENRTPVEMSRRKVVKMLVVIVVVFALCWLPTHVLHYFTHFDRVTFEKIPILAVYLMFWVSHANSALNPVLYIAFNGNFRYAFLDVSVALLMTPVHAISACTNYISGQQSIPELHRNQRPVIPQQDAHSHRVAPAAVGVRNNARMNHDTKL